MCYTIKVDLLNLLCVVIVHKGKNKWKYALMNTSFKTHYKNPNRTPMRKQTAIKVLAVVLSLLLLFSGTLFFSACNGTQLRAIAFNETAPFIETVTGNDGQARLQISMRAGDQLRIAPEHVQFTPSNASNQSFHLRIEHESIVTVFNATRSIRANQIGRTTLTIVADANATITTSIDVVVGYRIPHSVSMLAHDPLVRYSDNPNTLGFSLDIGTGGMIDPHSLVAWYVNDTLLQPTLGIGETFTLDPTHASINMQVGAYTVLAVVSFGTGANPVSRTATQTILIFDPFAITPFEVRVGGDRLEQDVDEGLTPLTFAFDYEVLPNNPPPIIEWLVNGQVVQDASSSEFILTPTRPNMYRVGLRVNGRTVLSSTGQPEMVVRIRGDAAPENLQFNYANRYPNLQVSWDSVAEEATYVVRVLTQNNVLVGEINNVTHNGANLASLIGFDINATRNVFNTRFHIYVATVQDDGDAGIFAGPLLTPLVPLAARPYLQRGIFNYNGNHYASSLEELSEIITYAKLFTRNNPRGQDSLTIQAYLGFDFMSLGDTVQEAANNMVLQALTIQQMTGILEYTFTVSQNLRHLHLTLTLKTDSLPGRTEGLDSALIEGYTYGHFPSSIPHVHFGAPRALDFILPIENRTPVSVTTSEQLFMVAERGFFPIAVVGSEAHTLYLAVRNTLRYIIHDDMDELQRIHAIFNYLTWLVRYDHAAIVEDTDVAVRLNAYYLEGVFFDRRAVCDGMAKAFSLMANMEGISALRIAGQARSSGGIFGTWNTHAWNRVYLTGHGWLNVDITWANRMMRLPNLAHGNNRYMEVSTHMFFLKTDFELRHTHQALLPNRYPPTTVTPFNIHHHLGMFLYNRTNPYQEAETLVEHFIQRGAYIFTTQGIALNAIDDVVVSITYQVGRTQPLTSTTSFISFDIRIHDDIAPHFMWGNSPLHVALQDRGLTNISQTIDGVMGNDFYIQILPHGIGRDMYVKVFIAVQALARFVA